MFKTKGGWGVKGVLDNIQKTAYLVERDIPQTNQDQVLPIHFYGKFWLHDIKFWYKIFFLLVSLFWGTLYDQQFEHTYH